VKQDLGGPGIGPHLEPPGGACRMQEHPGRRIPIAAIDQPLEIPNPGLGVAAVVVLAARDAEFLRSLDERLVDRVDPVIVGNRQAAATAVNASVGNTDAPLTALEVGQDIDITPAAIAALRPMIEILALA